MIEYSPQTSLSLMALGWQCLLAGKLIEFCSPIKHKMTCILSNNGVRQTSYKFAYTYGLVHVNCHSFNSRTLSLQTHRHFKASSVVSYAAVFVSIFTQREDKKS